MLEARRVLEPGVAQLAAVHATDADFAAMERTLELQRDHAHDWERLLQLDTRFHLDMARATHNPTLVGLVKPLLRQLEVARDMALRGPHVAAWTVDIHRRTIDALRRGDPMRDRRGHGRAPRARPRTRGPRRPAPPRAASSPRRCGASTPRPAAAPRTLGCHAHPSSPPWWLRLAFLPFVLLVAAAVFLVQGSDGKVLGVAILAAVLVFVAVLCYWSVWSQDQRRREAQALTDWGAPRGLALGHEGARPRVVGAVRAAPWPSSRCCAGRRGRRRAGSVSHLAVHLKRRRAR